MSIKLDWQQDVEDEAWSKRPDGTPPSRGFRWRWLAIGLAVLGVVAVVAVSRLSDQGVRAARADLRESLAYAHWTLQQQDQALFKTTLDASLPAWQSAVLDEWDELTAAANDAPAPEIESITLHGDLIEATVRWHNPATGRVFLAWQWFRLTNTGSTSPAGRQDWRRTQPVPDTLGAEQVVQRTHLTLTHHERDAIVAADVANQLDAITGDLCQRYGVVKDRCHFHLRWDVLDPAGQPLSWRDLALPPLAEVISEELNGPVYIQGATVDDWHGARVRQRLQRYLPGRSFVSRSHLQVLRPDGQRRLPDALLGDERQPIVLPTPWLHGIDEQGQPHPAWLAHTRRLLADAVLRRAAGFILGSPDHVNVAWALHQAVLAAETGQPAANRLAAQGAAPPFSAANATLEMLSSLGAALQSTPDEEALARLDDLSRYLQSGWLPEQVAALPAALGSAASIDRALNQALEVDGRAFMRRWQAQAGSKQPATPNASRPAAFASLAAASGEH